METIEFMSVEIFPMIVSSFDCLAPVLVKRPPWSWRIFSHFKKDLSDLWWACDGLLLGEGEQGSEPMKLSILCHLLCLMQNGCFVAITKGVCPQTEAKLKFLFPLNLAFNTQDQCSICMPWDEKYWGTCYLGLESERGSRGQRMGPENFLGSNTDR